MTKIAPRSQNQLAAAIVTDAAVLPTEPIRGKNRKRNADEVAHQDRVAQLGCIVCRVLGEMQQGGVEVHHVRGTGELRSDCHMKVLPLCFKHHRDNRHGIHGCKEGLKRTGKTERDLLLIVDEMLKRL